MAKKPPVNRKRQKQAARELIVRPADQPIELIESSPKPLTFAAIQNMRRSRPAIRTRSGIVQRMTGVEYGASGTMNVAGQIMRNDYNPLFDGKNGLVLFDQMDRSDGQVGAAGEIIKMPLRSAQWRFEPPEDATDTEKQIAEATNEAFFGDGMLPAGEGWDFVLRHLLMRVPFGFGFVEKVWMFDEDRGTYRYRRLAPRLPKSVDRFDVDENGTLRNIIQYVSVPGTGRFEYRPIPAEYVCLSVREREGDNYFGKSIYRRLYKHWFYKDDAYRINGIRIDRYGVGVPVAKIEESHPLEQDELDDIELTLMALRSHEKAWMIEPPGVTFRIMTPEGGQGGADGLIEWIQHNDTMIVRGILATFLSDQAEGLNSNRTRTLADIFLHALKGEANGIRDDVSTQLGRPYCDVNFDMSTNRYPVFKYSGIGDLTVEDLQVILAPMVTAGLITAEDSLEDMLRKLIGLPPLPKGWRRGDNKPDPIEQVQKTEEAKAKARGNAGAQGNADNNQGKSNDQGKEPVQADATPTGGRELYDGQPRTKQGQFSFGKKSGAPVGSTFRQSGGPEVGTFKGNSPERQKFIGDRAQAEEIIKANGDERYIDEIGGSANAVKIYELEDENGRKIQVIFKPESGESWTNKEYAEKNGESPSDYGEGNIRESVTNRRMSLADREVAAYELDKAMGTDIVPPTAKIDLSDEGRGVAVKRIEANPYSTITDVHPNEMYSMMVLDVATGNTDRHGGNFLVEETEDGEYSGRLWAIDHGYSFPSDSSEFRQDLITKRIFNNARQFIEQEHVDRIADKIRSTDWDEWASTNMKKLSRTEREAFVERMDNLKEVVSDPLDLYEHMASMREGSSFGGWVD